MFLDFYLKNARKVFEPTVDRQLREIDLWNFSQLFVFEDIACKRSKYFSKQELEVMVDEIIIRKRLLFGKLDSMITSENKKRAWAKVAQTVSAVADIGIVCDVNAVKQKSGLTSNLL